MSYPQNKAIARRFIQEIFNEGKIDEAEKFVTTDIIYHGAEEVRGLEDFKQWILEDRKAFPDMQVTIVDDIEEQNKVAIRWTLKATHEQKFETHGAEIFHFETGKISEAWTIFDGLTPALQLGIVEIVQPVQSKE
jgi:predicted SnoaL-like aldol condensation-catalyzing enzyme